MYDEVRSAADFISRRFDKVPRLALMTGTGFLKVLELMTIKEAINFDEIPNFPRKLNRSNGQFILAELSGIPLILMTGRLHFYEGFSMQEIAFPMRMLQLLNVSHAFFTNAAGSVNPHYYIGDMVMVKDHINLLPEHPLRGYNDDRFGPRFPDMSEVYDDEANRLWLKLSKQLQLQTHTGVYMALQGPSLETTAEYRMAHLLGADLIGMSTIPEVIVAKHGGLKTNVCSIVSNVCFPTEKIQKTSIDDIVNAVEHSVQNFLKVFQLFLIEHSKNIGF